MRFVATGALDEQAGFVSDEPEVAGRVGVAHSTVGQRGAEGGAEIWRRDEDGGEGVRSLGLHAR